MSNDDIIYIIGDEMVIVYKSRERISVSCNSVPEDINSYFEWYRKNWAVVLVYFLPGFTVFHCFPLFAP